MWVSRRELKRLLRTEDDLRKLRKDHDQIVLALLDRVLTASGRYGLGKDEKPELTKSVTPVLNLPETKTALEEAQLLAFQEAAIEEGRPPQEALGLYKLWRAGGTMPFQMQNNLIEE